MDQLIIDGLIGLGGLIIGRLSHFLHKPKKQVFSEVQKASEKTLSSPIQSSVPHSYPSHTKDKCYVRFHFRDGRVDVRPFYSTDLDLTMEWKGRKFEAVEWTPDGQIYKEVTVND